MSAAPEVAYGALPAEKRQAADRILRALPAWFGIDSAREADTARCADLPVLLTRRDGKVVGFLALQETSPAACEVYVMGAPTGRFFPRKIARGIEAVYPLRPQKKPGANPFLHQKTGAVSLGPGFVFPGKLNPRATPHRSYAPRPIPRSPE